MRERALAAIRAADEENGREFDREASEKRLERWLDYCVENLLSEFDYHVYGPYGQWGCQWKRAEAEG